MVTNCCHVRDMRGHWSDEMKEVIPFYQESSRIAYVSNVEDWVHILRCNFICHGFYHWERSWLQTGATKCKNNICQKKKVSKTMPQALTRTECDQLFLTLFGLDLSFVFRPTDWAKHILCPIAELVGLNISIFTKKNRAQNMVSKLG